MDEKEIQEKLLEPFEPKDIEWRVGATNSAKTSGIALPYLTNRAIQKRLDEVFGIFGWKNEFKEWKQTKQLCGISVLWNGEWLTKWDGADDSNMDGTKGGLSGAMKRCATQWGIGRYLYKIPNQWVPIEGVGKSYRIKGKPPELPNWALPKAYRTETNGLECASIPIPKHIQMVISLFGQFGVVQADLENYVNNEAFAFTDDDIATLRGIYKRLKQGEKKTDIFPQKDKAKNKVLDRQLEEMNK